MKCRPSSTHHHDPAESRIPGGDVEEDLRVSHCGREETTTEHQHVKTAPSQSRVSRRLYVCTRGRLVARIIDRSAEHDFDRKRLVRKDFQIQLVQL